MREVLLKLLLKNTHRNLYWTHSSFLLVSRPGIRTKTIGSLKGIHVYILRNMQYTEVRNNFPFVSNMEELRLYPLKSRKNSFSLRLCSLVCFNSNKSISVVSICFLYHILVFHIFSSFCLVERTLT